MPRRGAWTTQFGWSVGACRANPRNQSTVQKDGLISSHARAVFSVAGRVPVPIDLDDCISRSFAHHLVTGAIVRAGDKSVNRWLASVPIALAMHSQKCREDTVLYEGERSRYSAATPKDTSYDVWHGVFGELTRRAHRWTNESKGTVLYSTVKESKQDSSTLMR